MFVEKWSDNQDALSFEGLAIYPGERVVLVRGAPAKLGSRAFDILLTLATERHRIVGKDELMERVWPGIFVEENNLSVQISQLRKVCGHQIIATIPNRGYKFTGIEAAPPGTTGLAHSGGASAYVQPQSPADESATTTDPTPPLPTTPPGNAPAHVAPLIGRDDDVQRVMGLLAMHRWVTITGTAGVGKTRLAEALAHGLRPDGAVWIVELAPVNDPRYLHAVLAQTLGVTLHGNDRPIEAIVSHLLGDTALIVFDNCEHLSDAVAALCQNLMREVPNLRLIVTSQERLRSSGEAVYRLEPLPVPASASDPDTSSSDAVRLLVQRIRELDPGFELTADKLGFAAEICRQLDGLPLALELAASRVPLLGLAGVNARLGERFKLLSGQRVRLQRHQTLLAAFDWSYQLLSKTEQALFRRLGVFPSTFCIESVRLLASDLVTDDWEVIDHLGSLVDKSLVQVRSTDPPRYQLLETNKLFAFSQLTDAGEATMALERHARATQDLCRQAVKTRQRHQIWEEIPNIRAAFGWALSHQQAHIAVGLIVDSSAVLALGGLLGEVVQRLVDAEPLVSDALPVELRATYWQWYGRFGSDGRLPAQRCLAALEQARQLYEQMGAVRRIHACLRMMAEAHVEQGDLHQARLAINQARQLEGPAVNFYDRMRSTRIEAKIFEREGELEGALRLYQTALDVASAGRINRYIATLTQDIGYCHLAAEQVDKAIACFQAVIASHRSDLSSALAVSYAQIGLVAAQILQRNDAQALRTAQESLPLARSCSVFMPNLDVYAWLFAQTGEVDRAARLLRASDDFHKAGQTVRSPLQELAFRSALEVFSQREASANIDYGALNSESNLALLILEACAR